MLFRSTILVFVSELAYALLSLSRREHLFIWHSTVQGTMVVLRLVHGVVGGIKLWGAFPKDSFQRYDFSV